MFVGITLVNKNLQTKRGGNEKNVPRGTFLKCSFGAMTKFESR